MDTAQLLATAWRLTPIWAAVTVNADYGELQHEFHVSKLIATDFLSGRDA